MGKQKSILAQVCLAAVVGLGLQVAYALAVLFCIGIGTQLIRSDWFQEQLEVRADGTPTLVSYSSNPWQQSVRTLDGTPLNDVSLPKLQTAELLGPSRPPLLPIRRSWAGRVWPAGMADSLRTAWFFVHDGRIDGHGYYVGFDVKSNRRVGYIGRNGFQTGLPTSEACFPVNGRILQKSVRLDPLRVYLLSANRVIEIDCSRRSVRTVLEANGVISIGLIHRTRPHVEISTEEPSAYEENAALVVRTSTSVWTVNLSSGARQVYPIPAGIHRDTIRFWRLADSAKAAIMVDEHKAARNTTVADLYWMRPGGKPYRHERVTLRRSGVGWDAMDPRLASILQAVPILVPLFWTLGTFVVGPLQTLGSSDVPDYWHAVSKTMATAWPALLITLVLAAVAAWLCMRRQRRYALRWTRTWAVVVVLLGVPMWLGYLLQRVWPALIACPTCNVPAPRDRNACAYCGKPFPASAPRGTEVFA